MNALIVTGEKSAENYASILIDEFKKLDKNINFFSVSSDILESKTQKIADYRSISIIGLKEAFLVAGKAFGLLRKIKSFIGKNDIDVVILIDFPEFNMRIAKFAYKLGKKVVYYISPQVWAWRKYRVKNLFLYSTLVVPILPFEKTFFSLNGVDKNKIAYMGHPIVDLLHDKIGIHKKENIILIMPGSRKSEIDYNCKTMFEAAKIIKDRYGYFRFVWVLPKDFDKEYANKMLQGFEFIEVENDAYALMDKAYFGILKSGTTTLEAALFGLPMVVVYKLSKISYIIGKLIINGVNYISLPNLIYGKMVVKEFIEDDATAENIADEFFKIHTNPDLYNKMHNELSGMINILGEYPVTEKIVKKVYSIV